MALETCLKGRTKRAAVNGHLSEQREVRSAGVRAVGKDLKMGMCNEVEKVC